MPQRSKIDSLKTEERAWLDQQLIHRKFQDYEELEALLAERGLKIGKSSIHRYGKRLQRQMAAIQASTEAAQIIAEATPDEADARSGAVISMFQTGIFDAMLAMQDAEEMEPSDQMRLYAKAARGIADLTRASLSQKKWADEIKRRLESAKAQAVEQAQQVAMRNGLSDDDWGILRAQILGIEVDA
ncbi:MAG: DUF3486 family protein [Candidatus Thiodiazotropha sp. (ex Dulcina madagascariensis)]|nr:DUF3486 family protein [Candidatus Thiodiazotropha sp. (ex Dulcina madagascariensis)]